MATIQGDLGTNLTSVWLTDSSGLTTDLVTATGNDLTNSGVVLTTGVQGDAGDFERSDTSDSLTITNAAQTDLNFGSNDWTIAVWLDLENLPGTEENYVLVDKLGGDEGYRIDLRETGGTHYVRAITKNDPGGQDILQVAQTLSTSGFQQLVLTKSSTTGTFYVNGSSIGTGTLTSSITDSTVNFTIGNESGGGDAFDGIINQVCIWNGTALSGANITTLYNSGSGIEYADPAAGADNALTMCNF